MDLPSVSTSNWTFLSRRVCVFQNPTHEFWYSQVHTHQCWPLDLPTRRTTTNSGQHAWWCRPTLHFFQYHFLFQPSIVIHPPWSFCASQRPPKDHSIPWVRSYNDARQSLLSNPSQTCRLASSSTPSPPSDSAPNGTCRCDRRSPSLASFYRPWDSIPRLLSFPPQSNFHCTCRQLTVPSSF